MTGKRGRSAEERFWEKVDQSAGPEACWPYRGTPNNKGYMRVSLDGCLEYAHRVAHRMAVGPIPDGMEACHSCDNPPCCNPAHLHAGTHAQNMAEAKARGRLATGVRHGSQTKPSAFTGTSLPGDSHPMAILGAADVIEIRRRLTEGARRADMANAYGVSLAAVHDIASGRSWRHLLSGAH